MMKDATIAFAGMLQAGELVRQIATSGTCSQQAARASLDSIFALNPQTTEDVYGGLGGVRMGLRVLVELFSSRAAQDNLVGLNYALGMGKLARRIQRDGARQQALGEAISLVESGWRESEDPLDESVISQLADVYQRHVSTLDFRLSISGKPEFLKQDEKVALVRALLLAGIRSAFLWHQVGGRQWRLVFQRRKMLSQAEGLLSA
ncbi:MAG: high frequency lysogenization protein HflD [Wenzhouxiangella sp.]|nr:high frequency lysogenization protein HflD [Wenzhouxiangella sp.]